MPRHASGMIKSAARIAKATPLACQGFIDWKKREKGQTNNKNKVFGVCIIMFVCLLFIVGNN